MIFVMRILSGLLGYQGKLNSRGKATVRLLDDRQDIVLTHQQIFDVIDFDCLAGITAEQNDIALLQLARGS